jgi:regulatory protein YycH of two-component signal transduction system YycFG
MKEMMKSIVLTGLVCMSLLQSYFLAYSTPDFELANQPEYVETERLGSETEIESLLFPKQIILHLGDDRHTVLYPQTTFYNMIFQELKQRSFTGFRPVNEFNIQWNRYRKQHHGVEVRFEQAVPFSLIKRVMNVEENDLNRFELVDRIWLISRENQDEVKAYFFSDESEAVFEAAKVDVTIKDMARFARFGELQPQYDTDDGNYYVPQQSFMISKLRIPFSQYTAEQLQRSLFVDPANTRRIEEWDGTEIYTDGKRGLQVRNEQKWMVYSDPIAPVESKNDVRENLLSALQFINQHGGWNGEYVIGDISNYQPLGGQMIEFRQYVQSYPILPTAHANFGYMQVILQKGVVSNYERSLINLSYAVTSIRAREMPAGQRLEDLLRKYPKKYMIRSLFPAYRPYIMKGYIELVPEWAVKLRNGTSEFIE